MRTDLPWQAWMGLALTALALPITAAAELGGNANLVPLDQARLNASLNVSTSNRLTRFDLRLPSGTSVREYASPAGTVFAVSWDGPTLPDLSQLLGAYFPQYLSAVQGGGIGTQLVRQSGLVVYSAGHMRAFRGRAYLPPLQPQGVLAEQLP